MPLRRWLTRNRSADTLATHSDPPTTGPNTLPASAIDELVDLCAAGTLAPDAAAELFTRVRDEGRAARAARFAPTPITALALMIGAEDGYLVAQLAWATENMLVTERPARLAGIRVDEGGRACVLDGDGAWSMSRDADSLARAAAGHGVSSAQAIATPRRSVDVVELTVTSAYRDGRASFTVTLGLGDTFDGDITRIEVLRSDGTPTKQSVQVAEIAEIALAGG
jgi:hypothetical protein